jgi:hypothetical protein
LQALCGYASQKKRSTEPMMTAIVVEQKEAREAEIQFEIQRT